jgi:hypothetical protein
VFVCLRPVSCVPNVFSVSGLPIIDCLFGCLWRLYYILLNLFSSRIYRKYLPPDVYQSTINQSIICILGHAHHALCIMLTYLYFRKQTMRQKIHVCVFQIWHKKLITLSAFFWNKLFYYGLGKCVKLSQVIIQVWLFYFGATYYM